MRSFSIMGRSFQIPFMLEDLEPRMKFLEKEYPECKTIKEMDEKIQQEKRDEFKGYINKLI